MEKEFININLRLEKETYDFLKSCIGPGAPSISFIIRRAIHSYVYPQAVQPVQRMDVQPVQPVQRPPLEIPITHDSQVLESEPLISHRVGRKVNPDLYMVMKARRARDAGRDYDKSLEQHFNLLNELQ